MNTTTGTLTFLFTDIEGSTRLWETHADAMQSALFRHDALVCSAIEHHGGQVFKSLGDGFCALFVEPLHAVLAAQAIQTAIANTIWPFMPALRVRIAIHTGTAFERNSDYYGPTINRVARLRDAGHGGQTLISHTTHEHIAGLLPFSLSLLNLGTHQLRGLREPESIFQLIANPNPILFPALRLNSSMLQSVAMQSTLVQTSTIAHTQTYARQPEPPQFNLHGKRNTTNRLGAGKRVMVA